MTTSTTLRAVHEAGHNASKKHLHNLSDLQYEYEQEGLQNRSTPYPTLQNTLNILNEDTNY